MGGGDGPQITWMREEGCGGDGLADHMDVGGGLCGRGGDLADHMDGVWWGEMVWEITWMREDGCVVGKMVWQITWMMCGGGRWSGRSHG